MFLVGLNGESYSWLLSMIFTCLRLFVCVFVIINVMMNILCHFATSPVILVLSILSIFVLLLISSFTLSQDVYLAVNLPKLLHCNNFNFSENYPLGSTISSPSHFSKNYTKVFFAGKSMNCMHFKRFVTENHAFS